MSRKKIKGLAAWERVQAAILVMRSDRIMGDERNVTSYNSLFSCGLSKAQFEETKKRPLCEVVTKEYAVNLQKEISNAANEKSKKKREEELRKRQEAEEKKKAVRESLIKKFKSAQEELRKQQEKEFRENGFDGLMF